MPFSSLDNHQPSLFNFRVLLWINLMFLVLALGANYAMARFELFVVHLVAFAFFALLMGATYLWTNFRAFERLYLAIMAVYFYSFFWYGHIDTHDLIWLLLFPALVAFLVEKEKELILWHLAFISGVAVLFVASWFEAWGVVYSPKLIGAVLFANSFISILSLFNHRYKAKYRQAQEAFQQLLERRVEEATATIRQLNETLEISQRDVVLRLGEICEVRSQETGQHVHRVSQYSRYLAQLLCLNAEEIQLIQDASPLHDVGKVAIADAILNKPGKYTPQEYQVMQEHAMIGYRLLSSSPQPLLQAAALIARDHHEWWNGEGYPLKKRGEAIHLYGRIVAIADVFDALSFERIYKPAWADDKIKQYFEQQCETQFDPKICQLFLQHYDDFVAIRNRYRSDLSAL